ncbi:hypothetical protein BCR43DRAFT_562863 [Syncephalastrum racemosum]|uniref:Uncharacterized protein n=1 Tax=Syncephalastrum racemosum TaxID=13706 RepID=A0A1X2HEP9_SYNRA|nr:hypothetical protein BCR43DRAFT_562863 [Syncephalastrum racemosum]
MSTRFIHSQLDHAAHALSENNNASAETHLTEALATILEVRVTKALEKGNYELALQNAQELMTRCPTSAAGYSRAGDVCFARHNYQRAISFYSTYLDLNPSCSTVPSLLRVARDRIQKKIDPIQYLSDALLIRVFNLFHTGDLYPMLLVSQSWRKKLISLKSLWESLYFDFRSRSVDDFLEYAPRELMGPHVKQLTLRTNQTIRKAISLLVLARCTGLNALVLYDTTHYGTTQSCHTPMWPNPDDMRFLSTHLTKLLVVAKQAPRHALQYLLTTCPKLKAVFLRLLDDSYPNFTWELPLMTPEAPTDLQHLDWASPGDIIADSNFIPTYCPKLIQLTVENFQRLIQRRYAERSSHLNSASALIENIHYSCPDLKQLLVFNRNTDYDHDTSKLQPPPSPGLRSLVLPPIYHAHRESLELAFETISCNADTLLTLGVTYHHDSLDNTPPAVIDATFPVIPNLTLLKVEEDLPPFMKQPFSAMLDKLPNLNSLCFHQMELTADLLEAILHHSHLPLSVTFKRCKAGAMVLENFLDEAAELGDDCILKGVHISGETLDTSIFPLLGRIKTLKHISMTSSFSYIDQESQVSFLENARESGLIRNLSTLKVTSRKDYLSVLQDAFGQVLRNK